MGDRRNFSYRKEPLDTVCRNGFGLRSEITAKDCRRIINAAKHWVRNAVEVGPDNVAVLARLKREVDEAHGRRSLELVAGTMRVRDALLWQLRNDRAENTAVNGRLVKRMETYPPRDWDRLGLALYDAAQLAARKLRNSAEEVARMDAGPTSQGR